MGIEDPAHGDHDAPEADHDLGAALRAEHGKVVDGLGQHLAPEYPPESLNA
jgi:hypothetical protein